MRLPEITPGKAEYEASINQLNFQGMHWCFKRKPADWKKIWGITWFFRTIHYFCNPFLEWAISSVGSEHYLDKVGGHWFESSIAHSGWKKKRSFRAAFLFCVHGIPTARQSHPANTNSYGLEIDLRPNRFRRSTLLSALIDSFFKTSCTAGCLRPGMRIWKNGHNVSLR